MTEFRDGTSIMVPTGNPEGSIATLARTCAGETVVVTSGSTQVDLANTQSTACTDGGGDAIDLLEVPDDPDAMLAMNSGRADAYLVNTLAGSYAARHERQRRCGAHRRRLRPGLRRLRAPEGLVGVA